MLKTALSSLMFIAQTLNPIAAMPSNEMAEIWQSRDCQESHRLVATVSADIAAESQKYAGCLNIVYVMDKTLQASTPAPLIATYFTPPADSPAPRQAAGGAARAK